MLIFGECRRLGLELMLRGEGMNTTDYLGGSCLVRNANEHDM